MSTTISGDTGVDKATNQAVKDAMGITGTAPIFGCRAWVNFAGTRNEADTGASVIGQNVKIRGSGNVSSVLKNGVGDYTINFITAMPDINYCSSTGQLTSIANPATQYIQLTTKATSSLRVCTVREAVVNDAQEVSISIFR